MSNRQFQTTLAHQTFLGISSAFVLFEVLFLVLYGDKDWFAVDLLPLGVPAALLALAVAHVLLTWLEGPRGCRLFAFMLNGLPPVVYRKWILVNEDGFENSLRFGNKRVVWKAVDSVELTFFGNLLLKSRQLPGAERLKTQRSGEVDENPPFLLFKLPFGVAARSDQQAFVRLLLEENPLCTLNDRLQNQIEKDDPKGTNVVFLIVSIFYLFFFMDVGFATFDYLEILKHYYLAELNSIQEPRDPRAAKEHFDRADSLFYHPFQFSWVTHKLLDADNTKSGIIQLRAESLWDMGKRDEAVLCLKQALELPGKNFRLHLRLGRMLTDMGREKEALATLAEAVDEKREALVPRAYTFVLLATKKEPNPAAARRYFNIAMADFDDQVFEEEPS